MRSEREQLSKQLRQEAESRVKRERGKQGWRTIHPGVVLVTGCRVGYASALNLEEWEPVEVMADKKNILYSAANRSEIGNRRDKLTGWNFIFHFLFLIWKKVKCQVCSDFFFKSVYFNLFI